MNNKITEILFPEIKYYIEHNCRGTGYRKDNIITGSANMIVRIANLSLSITPLSFSPHKGTLDTFKFKLSHNKKIKSKHQSDDDHKMYKSNLPLIQSWLAVRCADLLPLITPL